MRRAAFWFIFATVLLDMLALGCCSSPRWSWCGASCALRRIS